MNLREPGGVIGHQNSCHLIHHYFWPLVVWECIPLSGRILVLANSRFHSDSGLRDSVSNWVTFKTSVYMSAQDLPLPYKILLPARILVLADSMFHSDSHSLPKLHAFQGVRIDTQSLPTPTTFPNGEIHECYISHVGPDDQGNKTISFSVLLHRVSALSLSHIHGS